MEMEEMLAFAYTECELSIAQFFDLTWYEWSLEVEKVRKRKERDYAVWEGNASLFRELMAWMGNIAPFRTKTAKEFKGTDFYKLSFDKPEEGEMPAEDRKKQFLSPEEVEKKFGKTLKRGK